MKDFLKKIKYKNGFTLIELLVATTLFTIVAVGGISVLLSSQRAYKRVSNNRVAIDNTNLVMDSISRELKFGNEYGCINRGDGVYPSWSDQPFNFNSFSSSLLVDDDSGFCNAIAFTPENDPSKKVVFYLNTNTNTIHQAEYIFNVVTSTFDFSKDYTITSSDFIIINFWIKVLGISKIDYKQPGAHLFMSGIVNLVKNNQGQVVSTSTFALESYISQRALDN
ncbi:MAG: hypothetical protein RI945_302 [Candidatus Parcubacteria bacterium]|jgi:prepilin-type N-terminal cleavage/methylation domain-containing protein